MYDQYRKKIKTIPIVPDKGLSFGVLLLHEKANKAMQTSTDIFYPQTVEEWREWMDQNHHLKTSVWLVQFNKASGKASITWSQAVDVALCYGWIDSKKIAVEKGSTHQFFTKRKAKSNWSKINKDKIERLIAEGLMTEAGLRVVKIAQQNGSWNALDEVEALLIPKDLETALEEKAGAKDFFLGLSKSAKKGMLYWVISAKREETRAQRIEEIASLAAIGRKPKQF
jgi:uncharacterized protein YdeI (YjbR/CyaY-like superfamily)